MAPQSQLTIYSIVSKALKAALQLPQAAIFLFLTLVKSVQPCPCQAYLHRMWLMWLGVRCYEAAATQTLGKNIQTTT